MTPVSLRVVTAVAERQGVDPADLPPLHESVDPDSLDSLFGDRDPTGLDLRFPYAGREVRIRDGSVVVGEPATG